MRTFLMKIIAGFFLIAFIFSPFVWSAGTAGITVVVTLEQVGIIEASVEFLPKIILPRFRYIRCYIELSEPFNVEDIDANSVALTEVNGASIVLPLKPVGHPRIGDYDRDDVPDLSVRFGIRTVIPLLVHGENRLTVNGNMIDGSQFKGTGTISFI